ncbi:MAG TPA: DUF3341 domain-containing protein [Devosia sp.]|nr:DUF3341 domain-containing protein [Devosia sp.]
MARPLHGLIAAFATPEALLAAAERARQRGLTRMDAFTPFPVDGLAELVGHRQTRLPIAAFIGGAVGAVAILGLQFYSVLIDYPLNVGGRPFASWPAFLVPAFECAILGAALVTFFGMLAANGLPRLYHPVFNALSFTLANGDRFYLLIQADDPLFDRTRLRRMLVRLHPIGIEDVAS